MTWGIIAVIFLGLILTYIIWQETRSHLQWRSLVAEGDIWAIRELVSAEVEHWHRMRPPSGVRVAIWAGVQSVELVAVGKDHIQVACGTEGEYRMAGGSREQVTSSLEAAMRLAAKLVEMVLYDIPEVKISRVRVDVYSTLSLADGTSGQRCILTTTANRELASTLDWDSMTPQTIIDRFESHYDIDERGTAREIDPGPPLADEQAERSGDTGGATD